MTQQKTERKNNGRTAVIVALLLALVTLLCFGGYTFSKYVTHGKGSGTASVAKWGYTASVDTTKLFGDEYKLATTNVNTVNGTGAHINVKADTAGSNLVAPGTTGSMTFTVGGKAEVRALISTGLHPTNDVVLKIKKTADAAYTEYRPVKWTLKKGGTTVVENETLETIHGLIATDASINKEIAPGDELTSTTYELSWAWVFENNGVTVADLSIDQVDTILGQMATGGTVNAPAGYEIDFANSSTKLDFTFEIKVSQLAK